MGDEKILGLLWCRRPVLYIWGYIPWSWQNAASKCQIRCPSMVSWLLVSLVSHSIKSPTYTQTTACHQNFWTIFLVSLPFNLQTDPELHLSALVCYCMLLRKSVQWARSSELTLALVPILHQPYLLAPWLFSFSLNKEANFAGAQGLYWNCCTMSWMRESFWYWRWSQGASRYSKLSGTPAW